MINREKQTLEEIKKAKRMCENMIQALTELEKSLSHNEEVVCEEDFSEVLYDSLDNRKVEG